MAPLRGGCRASRQPPAAAPSGPTSAPERRAFPPPAALSPGLNRCTVRGPGHSSPETDSRQELYWELPCGPAELVASASSWSIAPHAGLCFASCHRCHFSITCHPLTSPPSGQLLPRNATLISKPLLFRNKQFLSPRLGEALS